MVRFSFLAAALCAQFFVFSGALAQSPPSSVSPSVAPAPAAPGVDAAVTGADDEMLVENALTRLTRLDYNADVQRVPPDMRPAFASDPKRIGSYLSNLLLVKTLAVEARKAGVDNDPLLRRRIELEADRLIAERELKHIEDAAGAEFDARRADFTLKARELYLTNKAAYRSAEEVSASHILFDTKTRSREDALALAKQARAKLMAGENFGTLAKEVSDDPSAKTNGGALGYFGQGRMDPEFTKAAFALKNVGDVSEPVLSAFGYHLIRLDGRHPAEVQPFEAVQGKILAEMRTGYVNDARDAKISSIRNDPDLKMNKPAVDSLVFKSPIH